MTAPQPTPQWTALDFIVVAVLLLLILTVLAAGLVKSCAPPYGPAVDAAAAPFSDLAPVSPPTKFSPSANDAHSAGLPDQFLRTTKKVVGPLLPGGRWARLRERCRWEVA